MTPRQRVTEAMAFRPPDIIPLQVHPSLGGLYEHGQRLLDLMRACGHDFGDSADWRLPEPPPPEDYDADGAYHAVKTDDWGTTWEYRLFGVWGHPLKRPLDDLDNLRTWRPPAPPRCDGPEFEAAKAAAAAHRERYYRLASGGSLFEKLHSLRRFEDVLMDIVSDTPEINRLTDLIVEHVAACVRRALAINADAVAFGDDFGTQTALLLPPTVWRRFFKPRYKALFEPILKAGKPIVFHSCGAIGELLEDLRDLGVSAIWPQLSLFDLPAFARRCRSLGLALQLHPDRGELMQRRPPSEVRDYVYRLVETFRVLDGGSWLYIEIDPGFPFANVETLFEAAMALRS